MDDEETIRRITKLLEQGCTMLAAHHDCGAPLFRCEGEIICPACSIETAENSPSTLATRSDLAKPREMVSEVHFEGPKPENGSMRREGEEAKLAQRAARGDLAEDFRGLDASSPRVIAESPEEARVQDNLRAAKAYLSDSLLFRLKALAEEAEKEQDLDRLKKQLECIEGLVRVLKAMAG